MSETTLPGDLVEFGRLSFADWTALMGRDREVFGATSATLEYRAKDHHVGMRDADGRLLAAVGATVVDIEIEGHGPDRVVGFGALIVRSDLRGRGLATPLMDRIAEVGRRLGPDRAMMFCEPHLIDLYLGRGYVEIGAEVWVDQPGGELLMTLRSMWRPVRPTRPWPEGTVRVRGYPF